MPIGYDLLNWTSFPSSLKFINDKREYLRYPYQTVEVTPGKSLHVEVMVKQTGYVGAQSHISIVYWNGEIWLDLVPDKGIPGRIFPPEAFNWTHYELYHREKLPETRLIRVQPVGGGGTPESPSVTWFDDLKIYQDDVLIYSNDFSNWSPVIGAGIGAPIGGVAGYLLKEPLGPMVSEVVGAVVGGALGGGVGLLTGLGIIPVPQIPALGAAPEEPGAPARLGKYLITG